MDRTVSIVRNLYKPGRWCSKHCLPSLIRFRVLQRPSPQRRRQFHSCAPLLASRMADSDIRFRATHDTINPHMKEMQYAVRGPILLKAKEIESNINKGDKSYPFNKVLYCNIGDCHAMGQKPLTFVRQLLAVCSNPNDLLGKGIYPSDVEDRARQILQSCSGHSLGSYSDSRGIEIVRQHAAEFITKVDGVEPCKTENVYILNGASDGIKSMLYALLGANRTGVMIPVPQYPLYSATVTELNAQPIPYELDEDQDWAIDIETLRKVVGEARSKCEPRVMVVINPGNPTSQFLPVENMQEIIKFCHSEGLVLFTDEVYQENIYKEGVKFQSFRKILLEMGNEYSDFQMVAFNSTSKGFFGECGIRGGYMNLVGMDQQVMDQIYKHFSVNLCPNTPGQVVTDALVKRPKEGDPSYKLYKEEHDRVLQALARKAKMVYTRMNQIPGVSCNELKAGMYAFPRIDIPEEASKDAEKAGMQLDEYYCMKFLEEQGVCVVPGSGFGQKKGTWHFRTTILPTEEDLKEVLDRFEEFHHNFLQKYA